MINHNQKNHTSCPDKDRDKKKRARLRKAEAKRASDTLAAKLQQQQQDQLRQQEEDSARRRAALGCCGLCQKGLGEAGVTVVEVFGGKLCSAACAMGYRRRVQAEAAEKRFGKK